MAEQSTPRNDMRPCPTSLRPFCVRGSTTVGKEHVYDRHLQPPDWVDPDLDAHVDADA